MRDKVTRQCPQTTTFEEKGEPKRYRTEVLTLTSLPPYRYAKPALNERERERERQRETETETETDRQTDRQTERITCPDTRWSPPQAKLLRRQKAGKRGIYNHMSGTSTYYLPRP